MKLGTLVPLLCVIGFLAVMDRYCGVKAAQLPKPSASAPTMTIPIDSGEFYFATPLKGRLDHCPQGRICT